MDKSISTIILIALLIPLSSTAQNCNVLYEDFSSYNCHDCSIVDESGGEWIKYHPNAADARIYNSGIASDPILDIASEYSQPDNKVASQVIHVLNIDGPGILDYHFSWYNECGLLSIDFLESYTDSSNLHSLGYLVFDYDKITIGNNNYNYCTPWINAYNEVSFRLDFNLGELYLNCSGTLQKIADFTSSSDQFYGVAWGSNQCNYVEDICVNNLSQLVDQDGDNYFNDVDCDDSNPDIYPGATEIPNNGIDEDCDGVDAITSNNQDHYDRKAVLSPNPVSSIITTSKGVISAITDLNGLRIKGPMSKSMNLSEMTDGIYFIEITDASEVSYQKIIKQ